MKRFFLAGVETKKKNEEGKQSEQDQKKKKRFFFKEHTKRTASSISFLSTRETAKETNHERFGSKLPPCSHGQRDRGRLFGDGNIGIVAVVERRIDATQSACERGSPGPTHGIPADSHDKEERRSRSQRGRRLLER